MQFQIHLKPGALSAYYTDLEISRDELSRRMGIASTTAFRVEKGDVAPSPKFIASLLAVSGKRFEDLFEVVSEGAA